MPDAGETVVDDIIVGQRDVPEREPWTIRVIARADGIACSTTSPSRSTISTPESRTSCAAIDHLSNTPAQLHVFEALGATPPRYAHLPLLHGPDGKKLSKRHGAASVQELRDAGYLPEAVDNYIALLGAGFASDEEHFIAVRSWRSDSGSSASRRTPRSSTSASSATSTVAGCASSGSTS